MPSYLFDVATAKETERYPFTLDHDRPLGPQVRQVLEELRQRGVVLKGGPSDELGIYWMGRELDATLRPADLGISPSRPIELRMRDRPVPASRPDGALPRGVWASALLGYIGGLIAWVVVISGAGTARFANSYNHLDQVTLFVLGGVVGACVLVGAAVRTGGVAVLALVAGLVLGGLGALIGGSGALLIPGASSVGGFIVARVVGWALAAAIASLLLSCYHRRFDWQQLGESVLIGLFGGAVAGVVFVLPGASELWQGVAFVIVGKTMGIAVCGPALWHAAAVIELEPRRGLVPEVLTLREWPVHDGESIEVGALRIGCQSRRVALYPSPDGMLFRDRPLREPTFADDSGRVAANGRFYRLRVRQGGQ